MADKHLKEAIKAAAMELCCGDQCLGERLVRSMRRLDRFLGQREEWPAILCARSQDISDEFKGSKSVEAAIELMDLSQRERIAERILHLYADSNLPDLQQ